MDSNIVYYKDIIDEISRKILSFDDDSRIDLPDKVLWQWTKLSEWYKMEEEQYEE